MIDIEIDSDNGVVLILDSDELDPNGYPLGIEYTIDEWNEINSDV